MENKIMEIDGKNYTIVDVYDLSVTVPDSFVVYDNKTCGGHGEAKLYMGSKHLMRKFYTDNAQNSGFECRCFIRKNDLIKYMVTIQHEYLHPSTKYRGQGKNKDMQHLWGKRNQEIQALPDTLTFTIKDQDQIEGDRGYVKVSSYSQKNGYNLIREIALPFVSYISVMKLRENASGEYMFYWKLFTDFTRMAELQYAAKNYGKKKDAKSKRTRDGQEKYRQKLYEQFLHCPFTQIDDIRLLVASHIKPWSVCNQREKTDEENGLMLSPLFDKLFDRGFITFDDDGDIEISDWLSPANQERIDFSYKKEDLHLTAKRKSFLEYHRNNVFK